MSAALPDEFPVPVRCITLPISRERQKRFSETADRAALPFVFHYGIDAVTDTESAAMLAATADQVEAERRLGRLLSNPEIAVTHSHHRLYQELLDTEAPGALILEDDVTLEPDFGEIARGVISIMSDRSHCPEVVLFGGREGFAHRPILLARRSACRLILISGAKYRFCRVLQSDAALQRSCCYYVTREAARAILESERPIAAPSDVWDRMKQTGTLDQLYCIDPPTARHPDPEDPGQSLLEAFRTASYPQWSTLGKLRFRLKRRDYHRLLRAVGRRFGYDRCKSIIYDLLGKLL